MKHTYTTLAIAAALMAAGTAGAQQVQQFGRDSLYAVPAPSASKPSTEIVTMPVNRFGRDSVYASQTPDAPSTPVSADATGLQQNGRDSVYAYGSPNPPAATSSETKLGSADHTHGG